MENKGVKKLLSFNEKKFDAVSWSLSLLKKMKIECEEEEKPSVTVCITV